jgi:hypothetical protein
MHIKRLLVSMIVLCALLLAALLGVGAPRADAATRNGVDYSHISADWPAFFTAVKASGRDFIGRYLPIQGAVWRAATTTELAAAAAQGIDCFFWFENSGDHTRAQEGYAAGVADAKEALGALASLRVPTTTPVYYTCDFNNLDGSQIDAYFRGISSVVPVSQIGVYGDYDTIDWLYQHKLATYFCQTTAWKDSRGWHPQAQMHQNTATYMIGGVYVDRLTVTTAEFGQYRHRYEQSDARMLYSGTWANFSTSSASGGNYKRSSTAGASVTIPFIGTQLDWIATAGTTTGMADVYLDNVFMTTVDLSRASVAYQQNVWSTGPLASGYHTFKIVRNATSAAGKYLDVDRVDVAGSLVAATRIEQTNTHLVWSPSFAAWTTGSSSSYSGGSIKYINKAGSVTIAFTGVCLKVIAKKSPSYGKATITLDGTTTFTVSLYNATTLYKQVVWSSGFLTPGDHTVKVEWTGVKSVSTGGTNVNLDAVDVIGVLR